MNVIAKSTLGLSTAIALSFVATTSFATPASCPALSKLEQRIVDKADEGMPQLKSYVWVTARHYGIGMFQVADSIDQWRAASECLADVASKAQAEHARVAVASPTAD